MQYGTMCIALAILAASPVLAHAGRYELIPEPDVRQSSTNRVASADVIDKKASQFWICTARYDFQDLTANNGDCLKLPTDIGRPSLTETSDVRAVTGTTAISGTACRIMRADEPALTAPRLNCQFTGSL